MVSKADFDKVLARIKYKLEEVPKEFDGMVAQVGIPVGPKYAKDRGGQKVAIVAAIQEFGAPAAGIPPRPFIMPTVKAEKNKWGEIIASGIKKVIKGTATAFDVLDAVGIQAESDMKTMVTSIYSPALSPVTVILRKWRSAGRRIDASVVEEARSAISRGADPGSDNKPLNDSGVLIASIGHAVNKSGAKFKV